MSDEDVPWEGKLLAAAENFAALCSALDKINPYDQPTLRYMFSYLSGELIDYGFNPDAIGEEMQRALEAIKN